MPLVGLASHFYPTLPVFFWKVGHTPSCGQLCALVVYASNGVYSQGFPLYAHPVGIRGKSPLQGNIRYISLAVPLILEAAMVEIYMALHKAHFRSFSKASTNASTIVNNAKSA